MSLITNVRNSIAHWVVIIAILLSGVSRIGVQTQTGIQCPTATTQSVTIVSYKTLSNGDTVATALTRAPIPGDLGFKQCRCAEKKEATQKSTILQARKEFRAEGYLASVPILDIPICNPTTSRFQNCQSRVPSLVSPPLPPPPDVAA